MALTKEDLEILQRKFGPQEHEFLRGFAYITEDAVTARIEEVDPSWSLEVLHISTNGNNAVVHVRMTVKGVARDGVGMQQIMERAGEAEKGAATDAMKRAARLFGVGRYLISAPNNENEFKRWLVGGEPPASQRQPARPAQPQRKPDPLREVGKELGGVETPKVVGWKSKAEAQTFVREMEKAHGLTDTQVFTALGVDRLGVWTQGIDAARQRVEKWHSHRLNAEADKQSA